MKILLAVLILGLSASFFYQQLQFSSLESKLQLLSEKTNKVEVLITQAPKKVALQPANNTIGLLENPSDTNDKNHIFQIDQLGRKIAALEELFISLDENRVNLENKILSLQQEASFPTPQPLDAPQLSAIEKKELSKRNALEKQQKLMEKLTYEEVKADWALPMESKITDSFAVNEALSGIDSVQTQCKTTLCEISVFYNPTSDEDLMEFENEIVVALGENLTSVHGFKKSGSMEEGYSFTLIASP